MAAAAQVQNAPAPSFSRIEAGSVNLLPHKFTSTSSEPANPTKVAKEVIDAFNEALSNEDVVAVADLFASDSY